jgi:hypothetical protein
MVQQLELDTVVARLAAGETPESILATLRPAGERELLKRAVIVRTFDRPLFDSVLSADVATDEIPSFEQVVESRDVEALPRRDGVFRVRRGARTANWDAWWPEGTDTAVLPEPLTRLLSALVDYYEDRDQPIDRLAHLALIDEKEALSQFHKLFHAADERFDLAECQDLIDVLNDPDRARFIGEGLIAARDDRVAYLGARSLWSSEYYQSETFVKTEGVLAPYEDLLEGESFRVINLHGPGGRGKTIQVRWLIARQLVPEIERGPGHPFGNGRIPCAKVDFDFVDPVNATRYPWLVLLEAAAQLNDQLTRKWFNELLDKAGWAIPLLSRNPADPTRTEAASKRMRTEGRVAGETVVRGFSRNLNESTGKRPVVLVLDTLEEVHLRPQGDLKRLLELLAEMLGRCPGLRLVLSGRYSVAQTLGEAAAALPDMHDVPVRPFSEAEAHRYLEQYRGVSSESIRDAIVAKAGVGLDEPGRCDPLVLSLLADEVQARPKLTAAQIARYPAEVIRLINRIVRRIHEPGVRWILRYGVVPRSLTLAFVRDVMEPQVRRAMAGERTLDAPDRDELPTDVDADVKYFPTVLQSQNAPLDVAALWTSLRTYAGSTSWVYPDPNDEQVLRFRADVAVPMRDILRRQRVFRRLHRDAAEHFERKAREEPRQYERWTREAIYHRFQLRGPAAAASWRAALRAAGRNDPETRAVIAAELLETDYVDEKLRPRPWRGETPIVDPRTLVEARFEQASALSELARARGAAPDDQLWSSVEKGLAAVERGQAGLDRPVVRETGLVYLRAGLALKEGRVNEAEEQLRLAVRKARGSNRARLLTLLGDAELARGDRCAPERYVQAQNATLSADEAALTELDLKLLVAYSALDQLEEAYEVYCRALTAIDRPRRGPLRLHGALIGLGSGRFTWAEETAAAALREAAEWDGWVLRVFAAVDRFAPAHASALAASAEAEAGTATSAALDPSAQAAWSRELVGIAAGELMQYDRAFGALESARSLWHTQGDAEGVVRCQVRSAAYKLRGTGDVKAAEHHLDQAEEFLTPESGLAIAPSASAWLAARVLRAELERHVGRVSEATSSTRATIHMLGEANAPPRSLVRGVLACLASAEPADRRPLLELLVAQCVLITPASARIVALRSLRDVPELSDEDARAPLEELRSLTRIGSQSRLAPADRGVLHLLAAELERVSGNRAAAARRLASARGHLSRGGTGFFLREWWLAVDRLGQRPEGESASRDAQSFVGEFEQFPLLCVAFLVERLEATATSNRSGALQLLQQADRFLERTPDEETQWHARVLEARARLEPPAETRRPSGLVATAGDIYVGLGDASRAQPTARTASEDVLSELHAKRARITVGRGPEGLRVRAEVTNTPVEAAPPLPGPLMRVLAEWERVSGRASSYELEDMWSSDPSRAALELGALLYSPATVAALHRAPGPLNVRLEIEDVRLNLLPWELARVPDFRTPLAEAPALALDSFSRATSKDAADRDETRFLQIALNKLFDASLAVDGDFGPASVALLGRYQEQRGLQPDGTASESLVEAIQTDLAATQPERPLVILAQPSAFSQLKGKRGNLGFGVDTGRMYEAKGLEVWRVESPSLAEIYGTVEHALAQKRVPAVLHLSGGLRESPSGVAFTFAAGAWYAEALGGTRTSDELPVTAVADLIRAFPRDSFSPLVILDVDRPPGITETLNQLFLRNMFAGEVFELGRCPALIATGLVDEGVNKLYGPLTNLLGSGATVGSVCQSVRHINFVGPTNVPFDFVPGMAIALFTHLPWLRPVIR